MSKTSYIRRGFTLIELIVVVLILTLMTGLAVARLDFLVPKYRLRAATRETAAVLKQARSRAASIGRDIYVRIHLSDGRYEMLVPFEVESQVALPPDIPPELIPPPEYRYESLFQSELPKDVQFVNVILGTETDQTITSGNAQIRISPFGASDHVIVNFRLEDRDAAIRLNGLTGIISFFEEEKKAAELLEDQGD
ncbi:MAG TPA: prepilin-type N-terminal cleavage/methylation domain-containing protein [Planctomycetota bacterium]|nr:prepilin-type N-terminal cleavage/methylation domain-containing protein [Planctomycetota bacterium]